MIAARIRVSMATSAFFLATMVLGFSVLVGCAPSSSGASSTSSSAAEEAAASVDGKEASVETGAGNQASEDTSASASGEGASYENLPVPSFSELFKMSKGEAAEYLAAYPHETSGDSELIDLVGWAEFYSSDVLMEEWGINWKYTEGECAPGSWSMKLDYDDSDTLRYVDFFMTPLSGYGSSSDVLAPSETYAAMIENYLASSSIQEMTVAVRDVNSGRDGNYANDFDGYVLFDDLQADVGTYEIRIFPNPNPNGFNWEEVKGWISDGYYLDKHSGGVTYTIPYVDVYSTAEDL